ncbi:pseudouridylate synthase [Pseudostreptobacillus hongkongensis]|uniref:pseudouridylate synthase n=1 Tax=Pseudostreptobacillus hongkongensis TaxID=1162717 RepID=UPI0028D0D71B|nr:pseudouridylate synthase [Pseudostreptobacillus hongkongensis]
MKRNKVGYLLEISYKGKYFDAFDEIPNKKTVKGVLKKYLQELGVWIYKGIQQAGRTDAKVSANSNYIYFVANKFNTDILLFNESIEGLKIKSIKEVPINLVLPDLVERRVYIYYYPKKFINLSDEEIEKRCLEISGNRDFSEFTNHKGLKLKNHIRDVNVSYIDGKLYFDGNSFMPQQVRIMSGYILKGEKKPMNPKFLILDHIILKGEI